MACPRSAGGSAAGGGKAWVPEPRLLRRGQRLVVVGALVAISYGEPRYHTPADLGVVVLARRERIGYWLGSAAIGARFARARRCERATRRRTRSSNEKNRVDRILRDWRIRRASPMDPEWGPGARRRLPRCRALPEARSAPRIRRRLDPAIDKAAEFERFRLLPGEFPDALPDGPFDVVTFLAVSRTRRK